MAANNIKPNSGNDNNCEQYFEGVEKLLEIWFTNDDGENSTTKQGDLRKISRQQFESLLKIVRCEIISYISNDEIDAYVLSESSMFVSKRRLILKTCGTTTPLLCLGALLRLAEQIAGFTNVQDLFYSRKNYGRPELQHTPHQAFDQEVTLLDSFFENGSAYCLGSMNRDCWYLYTLNPAMIGPLKSPSALETSVMLPPFSKEKQNDEDRSLIEPDQTLEILMTNLDLDIMAIFTRDETQSAAEATKRSGIDKLIPNMVIDDFLFEPCGYSMNGISKTGHYMTIHITPEQDFSYVSFETNAPLVSYKDLMNRVLNTFKPNEAVVTIFANQTSMAAEAPRELDKVSSLGDWLRRDIQHCRFKHYDLTYAFYSKFPS
ncbi:S-adenosylmethionine decarboxylase proenzyme isoform X2 [Chrysoperla carnea]|uniref:S-adenosylmethionine decarboxylase proenzyme isoform X2 n=1 Tax=Chrysoperla carnea TaxID=189513 RepID=UPI001D097F01|nr:S-adenosylmethionine decarboxylase proenzyme isoform X2 [Chrysoperla carnea]